MNFWSDPVSTLTQLLMDALNQSGLSPEAVRFIMSLIGGFVIVLLSLMVVIFLILLERKLIGRIQDRLGPNRVGPFGLFQTFADMIKIFTKEYITPQGVDWLPYNLAPILAVGAVIMLWAVIPFAPTMFGSNLDVGVLYIAAVGAIGELGIILAGWGSNNKYALLGAFRAVAQLISYEIPMMLALLVPVMLSGSMSLAEISARQTIWYIVIAPVAALIYFLTSIAEVGRAPFDLLEADSELVSGFNIEYSGLKFGFFYVGDFLHAFTIALLFAALFMGGWRGPGAEQIPVLGVLYFLIKTAVVYFAGIMLRGSLPRFRIDQMMNINWKLLTPLALATLLVTALVDKGMTLAGLPDWSRAAALLLANIVIFAVALRAIRKVLTQIPRHEVPANKRPLARPENVEPQIASGEQS